MRIVKRSTIAKLNYINYIDDNKFGLKDERPEGSGGYNFRNYTIGPDNRKPTSDNVATIVNQDFDQIQTDFKFAFNYFGKYLGASDKRSLRAQLTKAKDDVERRQIQRKYDNIVSRQQLKLICGV